MILLVTEEIRDYDLVSSILIGVGRFAVGAPLAGRCYRRLARVLLIWDSTDREIIY